ncbi:MAG: PIN domain-containing protein [Micrococcales bacterium]|nr:PIN domain-containing protein [Micrococcales bacterium]
MGERPTVVFDTDVYVNAIVGPDTDWAYLAGVLQAGTNPDADCLSIAFDAAGLRLMTSPHILTTVERTLRRLGVGTAHTQATLDAVLDVVEASGGAVVKPARQVFDLPDPKHNLVMDLALAVNAALVVTDDADLTALDPWRGIPVLRLRPLHRPGPGWPGR